MEYELYFYNQTGDSARVFTLEMTPMALHGLCYRIMQSIERKFPPNINQTIETEEKTDAVSG